MKTKLLLLLSVATLSLTGCKKDRDEDPTPQPQPFTYSAPIAMSTGSSSTGGTAAPSGYTWSEIKNPGTSWGISADLALNQSLADDFVVPSGEKWTVQNIYLYAYQTGFAGATFPVNEVYFEIYSSDPSVAGAVKVFGDLTTNRFVSAEDSKMYRILQGQPDGTTRKIYKIKTQVSNLVLTPGTYWIKWTSKTTSGGHYYAQLPYDTTKPQNAKQLIGSSWGNAMDNTIIVGFPIEITGTKLPN